MCLGRAELSLNFSRRPTAIFSLSFALNYNRFYLPRLDSPSLPRSLRRRNSLFISYLSTTHYIPPYQALKPQNTNINTITHSFITRHTSYFPTTEYFPLQPAVPHSITSRGCSLSSDPPHRILHHSHSPGVVELNVWQDAHLHVVAPSGRSYGCAGEGRGREWLDSGGEG